MHKLQIGLYILDAVTYCYEYEHLKNLLTYKLICIHAMHMLFMYTSLCVHLYTYFKIIHLLVGIAIQMSTKYEDKRLLLPMMI